MLRAHYEKVIVACCLLTMFVNVGFTSTAFNVYQPFIADAIGHEAASNVLLLRTFVSLIALAFVGRWYDLLDCRLGVFVSNLLTAAGFFAYSMATSFVGYCVAALFVGVGYGFGGMVAATILVGRWYENRIGTAVGVVATGSSLAGILLPMCATFIIQNVSLAWSFRIESFVALALGVVVVLLVRNKPIELGLEPYRGPEKAKAQTSARSQSTAYSLSRGQRLLMVFAMVLMGCVAVDGWNYLSVLMTHSGFDVYFAATMLSVGSIAMVAGKVSTGALFDRIGVLQGSVVFFALLIAGLGLCTLADLGSQMIMAAGALVLGFGISLGTVGISVWSIDLSQPLERTKLVKDFQVAYAFGGFVFNLLPGRIVEAGGSYTLSYGMLTLMCVIEAAIVIGIYMSKRKGA